MTNDIATIMVVVDGDHPSDTQLQGVGTLAVELGARIIGVSASEHAPSFYFAAGAVATGLLEEDERRMKERMAAAEKRCRKVLEGCSASVTWRSAVDLPIDVVLRESRAADFLVCFSRRNSSFFSDVEPGELVLKSGRPLLVVPEAAKWRSPKRILIGWKDSRESRRAVRDALPFLRGARTVGIVKVVVGQESAKAAEARLGDVASWLKAHSVEATPQMITPRKDAIDALAGAMREFNPDWVVAGAYGHSRLGEWIFGGVTRHLLMQSDRPAFLSH